MRNRVGPVRDHSRPRDVLEYPGTFIRYIKPSRTTRRHLFRGMSAYIQGTRPPPFRLLFSPFLYDDPLSRGDQSSSLTSTLVGSTKNVRTVSVLYFITTCVIMLRTVGRGHVRFIRSARTNSLSFFFFFFFHETPPAIYKNMGEVTQRFGGGTRKIG